MLNTLPLKEVLKFGFILLSGLFINNLKSNSENIDKEIQRQDLSNCIGAQPFCSDQIYTFENSTNTTVPRGVNYGCLSTPDNPIWYYMEVGVTGPIRLKIQQTTQPNNQGRPLDVDFALWGPFESYEIGCTQISNGNAIPIQSSYSSSNIEYAGIGTFGGSNENCNTNSNVIGQSTTIVPQQGEIYIILLTNYSGESGYITFNQESGTGGANCEIVNPCNITNITGNANCNGQSTNYAGQILFSDPPEVGTLTITSNNGGSQTFFPPFSSPINFNFNGPSGFFSESILSATFSEDGCTRNKTFNIEGLIEPEFNLPASICNNDNSTILPTRSINGITGVWDKTINNTQATTYTFTPNANQCSTIITKSISIKTIPDFNIVANTVEICTGNTTSIQLDSANNNTQFSWEIITSNVSGASNGNGNTITQQLFTNNPNGGTVIYIITPILDGCEGISKEITIKVNPNPEAFAPTNLEICSNENAIISLSSNHLDVTYNFTVELINATGGFDGSGATINQTLTTISNDFGFATYYITPNLNGCIGETIEVKVKINPKKEINLVGGYICFDVNNNLTNPLILNSNLGEGNYSFEWYNNDQRILYQTNSTLSVTNEGNYFVIATDNITGCISRSNTASVTSGSNAHFSEIFVENNFELGTIKIEMRGSGNYLYQIDGKGYQSQPIFTNVLTGTHIIEIKDIDGCFYEKKYVTVISYPNFFTPNGDGIHETWNIWSLNSKPDSQIYIFDRAGKLLKQITPAGEGWDGTINGIPLPATDYWFIIKYQDGKENIWKEFKSHFSLKR